ncbi:phage tail protein [Pseudomonas sp. B11D7D]|nr:phage tail protein [Pseudomonas sp. B11D7D]QNH04445.1 phage tail protein [Pseudomonas sp. B11D7D]
MSTYFAILTDRGEAKLANAQALGTQVQYSHMAVGDGNGALPVPDRMQPALVREQYRAGLNELKVDPLNASQIIAELVIPENVGGWWIREMGIYDADGDLIAVANCPPSYKPLLAEGSGRTQVLRMVLIVSSTAAVQLKIDPSVVLATRAYADSLIAVHMLSADPHPQYTTVPEVNALIAAEMNSRDSKQSVRYTTTGNINLSGLATQAGGDWPAAMTAGDRVLVKDQATGANNGLYVAAAGAWARAADADASAEVTPGMLVTIEEGATLADTVWELTTNGPIVLGTTALSFELTAALTATLADAETGTNNVRRMTALRVFQALRSAAASATELLRGVLRVGTQAEVDAGALDDVAVTPKKLRWGFAASITPNGYILFPTWLGSWMVQWATLAESPNASTPVSWVMAFPNNCFGAIGTALGGAGNLAVRVNSPTKNGALVMVGANYGDGNEAFVIAVGN